MQLNYKSTLAILGLLLLSASCASQLRPANAPLVIQVRSVDFVTGSSKQIRFNAKGFVRNPNDLAVKSVGFTYQTFIEGKLVGSGNIDIPAAFPFKSRTPFVTPIRIPTNHIGGYVNATNLNGLRYKIDLQLTDERYKRVAFRQAGQFNLTPVLKLPSTKTTLSNVKNQLIADIQVINPNPFILLIDSCSINFVDYNSHNELFASGAVAPKGERSVRMALPFSSDRGQNIQALSVCIVDGTPIEQLLSLTVR